MLSISIKNSITIPFIEEINNQSEYLIENPKESYHINDQSEKNESLTEQAHINPESSSGFKEKNKNIIINSGEFSGITKNNLLSNSKTNFSQFLKKEFPSEENEKILFQEIGNNKKFNLIFQGIRIT